MSYINVISVIPPEIGNINLKLQGKPPKGNWGKTAEPPRKLSKVAILNLWNKRLRSGDGKLHIGDNTNPISQHNRLWDRGK